MMQASRECASEGHMEVKERENATEAVTACDDPGYSGWQLSRGWVFKCNQG
jgi:hypothetical protein